jgi:putative hydrolase of the HAD superfamily
MIHAVLFDMGGTLDGDGRHWLDRFVQLYASAGVRLPRETIRAAFDAAERHAAVDEPIASAGLDGMIARHVDWQLAHLGLGGDRLRTHLIGSFVGPIRAAAVANRGTLAALAARGLTLGVVSNGCGNVAVLCDELGYSPHLTVIVDSRWVGLFKPDPAIFLHAAGRLAVGPRDVLMVGDSLERDMVPAKAVGMKTAWLGGSDVQRHAAVDVRLRTLGELPAALDVPVWPAA